MFLTLQKVQNIYGAMTTDLEQGPRHQVLGTASLTWPPQTVHITK